MGALPAAANDAAAATAAPLDTTEGGSPLKSDAVEGMIRSAWKKKSKVIHFWTEKKAVLRSRRVAHTVRPAVFEPFCSRLKISIN